MLFRSNLQQNPHELLAEHHQPAVSALLPTPPTAQQINLADQPEYATQLQQMQQLLKAEMQRLNDPALLEF